MFPVSHFSRFIDGAPKIYKIFILYWEMKWPKRSKKTVNQKAEAIREKRILEV